MDATSDGRSSRQTSRGSGSFLAASAAGDAPRSGRLAAATARRGAARSAGRCSRAARLIGSAPAHRCAGPDHRGAARSAPGIRGAPANQGHHSGPPGAGRRAAATGHHAAASASAGSAGGPGSCASGSGRALRSLRRRRAGGLVRAIAFGPDSRILLTGLTLIREKKIAGDAGPDLATAAKKITGVLSLSERTVLEKAGTESAFADAMAARIALEMVRLDATRLISSQPPPLVDDASVKAVVQIVDAAAARLQKEADVAIGRGEVESLQLITASSAALSRDLHSFKEIADRLRGVGSAPRLGAGSLDPEVVLPGQMYRPPPKASEPMQVRAELREFQGLGEGSRESRGKSALFVCMLALAGALVNVLFFAYPRIHDLQPIPGIARIEVSEETARVTLAPDFAEKQEAAITALTATLRERGVQRALLVQQDATVVGQLLVNEGKTVGLPPPAKRNDVPLPQVPPQEAPVQPAPQAQPAPAPPAPAPPAPGSPAKKPAPAQPGQAAGHAARSR